MQPRQLLDTDFPVSYTDEELTALALRNDTVWASALPTLASASADELAAAASRGWRSLLVRNLMEDGELKSEPQALLGPALQNQVMVRSFLADDAGTITDAGTVTSFYATDRTDFWLAEFVSPDGIHQFGAAERAACTSLLELALEDVRGTGLDVPPEWPDDLPRPTTLCVAAVDDRIVSMVTAKVGSVEVIKAGDAAARSVPDVAAGLDAIGLGSATR